MNVSIVETYPVFLEALIAGDRREAKRLIETLLGSATTEDIYFDLIHPVLYEIGRLWETNNISVSSEHIATAIVEGLLSQIFYRAESAMPIGKCFVMACPEDEHHQMGSRIIADYFEQKGWQTVFIGSNTPVDSMVSAISDHQPDLVGLSFAMEAHFKPLVKTVEALTSRFPALKIIVGGRGLEFVDSKVFAGFSQVSVLRDLEAIKRYLEGLDS